MCILVGIYEILPLFVLDKRVSSRLSVLVCNEFDILDLTIFLKLHFDCSFSSRVLQSSHNQCLVWVCCQACTFKRVPLLEILIKFFLGLFNFFLFFLL